MKRTLILTLFLLLLSAATHGQSNCSYGLYQQTGDNYNPGICVTRPQTINTTETKSFSLQCIAGQNNSSNITPGSTYATDTSTVTGTGQKRCWIGNTSQDCPPRMVFYEVNGGANYPDGTKSDYAYNRFFNQAYNHGVTDLGACYEFSGPPVQDFKQCPALGCYPVPPPPRCCRCPGPNVSKGEQTFKSFTLRKVQTGICPQGSSETCCGSSPILIDTSGNGFLLTSAANGVTFDITGTGSPIQLAWTAPGVGNAFLCLPDSRGACDDGKDLFGNKTPQPPSDTPNGFAALAVYDQAANGGNGDGIIDSHDAIFSSLRLWIDANHDGKSQPNEIYTLSALGVHAISLNYKQDERTDQYGNVFRYRAQVNPGGPPGTARMAYDVFFAIASGGTTTAEVCPAAPRLLPDK